MTKKPSDDNIKKTSEATEPSAEVDATQDSPLSMKRRDALSFLSASLLAGTGLAMGGCQSTEWKEFFKKNYRLMTPEEKKATIQRLEAMAVKKRGKKPSIATTEPVDNVLFGYAFNITKCQGYMDCVNSCMQENNIDRNSAMRYLRVFEIPKNQKDLENGKENFTNAPNPNRSYMGAQCFQCDNPPCVKVCPVGATWQEKDGIVVVDYDWCIGCRYCQVACPYEARTFNWKEPQLATDNVNLKQHYLGNRERKKGVVEKCHFCIQRTREGQQPACVQSCPTGARVFGNLLDPKSEIRYVLANKKVFRLKEELNTDPKFWYFMD